MPIVPVYEAPSLVGHTILVRASLNVPLEKGEVANTFRLKRATETLQYLVSHQARVVVLSHIDGPPGVSLEPVARALKQWLPVTFVDDVVGVAAREAVRNLKNGQVLVLQNLRRDKGEEANDDEFVRKLVSMGDIFVNDDFAAAHRTHASIVGIPKYLPSYAGLQFIAELEGLKPALHPESPSLAIVGGAKFITKEPLIKKLLSVYDQVFIGGALANDFLKVKGYEVGKSLVSHATELEEYLKNSKVLLPLDVTVDDHQIVSVSDIGAAQTIFDEGPETLKMLAPYIAKARTILWNGPLGNFEIGYREQTEGLAKLVAASSGRSIVGGGDTIASIDRLKIEDKFTFVSTAGGAMLAYLAGSTLPGIEALSESKQAE